LAASPVPVTAKIRTGWDEATVNYREVGLLLQDLGVAWVTLHGRTRQQKYRGRANWDRIADLVETLDIPVIGNGDVVDGDSYAALVRHTRCHAVMIGRGAIGNPWLFAEMRARDEGRGWTPPDLERKRQVMADLIREEVGRSGEQRGSLDVRKHLARCFRGYPGAAALRRRLFATEGSAELLAVLASATDGNEEAGGG
jgi:tRNA-dihydrouridine synthase